MGPLISATDLHRSLGAVKVFDLRWALMEPNHGQGAYLAGHIPGAVFVDLDIDLCSPRGAGRHPLPGLADFSATLGRLGLAPGDPVAVYDDAAGAVAARMWWMLISIGHSDVAVLDGGYQTWVVSELPVETDAQVPIPARYKPARAEFQGVVDHLGLAGREIVDVREASRYAGEYEPIDPKAGHIPGAVNIPLRLSLDHTGLLREPARLASLFEKVGDHPVISCGSGVNACHTALAMTVAGRALPDIYIGSFSDWSSRDLPIHTGQRP